MRLSRREEIAVAILVACARAGTSRIHTEDAARVAGASSAHTAQIVHRLVSSGLVDSQRGRYGGITLAEGAERATLGEVLRRFGARRRLAEGREQPGHANDPLVAIANAAQAQAADAFDSFTIADLATDRVGEKLVCFACSIRLGVLRGRSTPAEALSESPARTAAPPAQSLGA